MGNYSVNTLRNDYITKWDNLVITKPQTVDAAANKVIAGKTIYQELEKLTGVPWYMIGVIHYRESDCNFHTHLHNGDSLNARTHHVPAGRPVRGNPPFTFIDSAVDALNYEGFAKIKVWSLEQICYSLEQYNGWGYRYKHTPSAYLYADTNQYHSGKYVADGVFDPSAIDTQVGVIGILKDICVKENIAIPKNITEPIPTVPATASIPSVSPKADIPVPSTAEMTETSRKYYWTRFTKWIASLVGLGTGAVQTAQTLNLDQTKGYAQAIKDTADIIGTWGLIAIIIGIIAYAVYMEYLMKQDVQQGRSTPSAEPPIEPTVIPTTGESVIVPTGGAGGNP